MRVLVNRQGTPEWDVARKGRVTASSVGNVLAGKNTKTRTKYMRQLVMDLEGVPDYQDNAPWFLDGRRYEAHARGWYQWHKEAVDESVGFALHDEYNWFGASPDGLVGDRGCIEIKYRKSLASFEKANTSPISRLYKYQMQATMWVCNRYWCDYVNYWRDDRTEKEQAHVRRIARDEGLIRELEAAAIIFWADTLDLFQKQTGRDSFEYPWDIYQRRRDENHATDR